MGRCACIGRLWSRLPPLHSRQADSDRLLSRGCDAHIAIAQRSFVAVSHDGGQGQEPQGRGRYPRVYHPPPQALAWLVGTFSFSFFFPSSFPQVCFCLPPSVYVQFAWCKKLGPVFLTGLFCLVWCFRASLVFISFVFPNPSPIWGFGDSLLPRPNVSASGNFFLECLSPFLWTPSPFLNFYLL
jgi:hypothetical protein